ncbi:PH domain-containing protein [Mangrovivirga sp. M17]|uniref:PH domain-containing protein n=1 Tax=Mangrovivirga halotolerans TaxID=2993936 RepID=A0ABT3RMV1_9BACT|nr:PH domain-containing protein [Mangrovivirga halotolerans]MCX2742495.1 PH domain-containing protein [Mangrovivirga halotolerans]
MVVKSKPGGLYLTIVTILLIVTTYGVVKDWWAFSAIAGSVFLLVLTFIRTYYRVHNNYLYIFSGFLYTNKLDLSKLESVENVNSYKPAPALSHKRLRLKFNDGKTLDISMDPQLEESFTNELKNSLPG